MINNRPVIGVTGPDRGGLASWLFTWFALFRSGAKAVRITPAKTVAAEKLDGLVIGGGADIDPERYLPDINKLEELKEEKRTSHFPWYLWVVYPAIFLLRKLLSKKQQTGIDKQRDELELSFLDEFICTGKPVMGICRGAQLINIFFGGTLFQDLSDYYEETPQIRSIFPRKEIIIEPESHLSKIFNKQSCMVNALHNQAIDKTGDNIRIVAREKHTRVIQAIEHSELDFVVGVQWHPEYLAIDKTQHQLFAAFTGICKNRN